MQVNSIESIGNTSRWQQQYYERTNACFVPTTTASRRRQQQREATAIMHSILQFPTYQDSWDQRRPHNGRGVGSSDASISSPAGVGSGRYQYNTGARSGGAGYTVIDDDDWQAPGTQPLSSTDMSYNFPTLPRNADESAAPASASNAKALWGNKKALGAVKNAPKSSKLKKAEMTDSWDAPVTKAPKPAQSQTWRGNSATRKRLSMSATAAPFEAYTPKTSLRLVLQPRSKPAVQEPTVAATSNSIFGGGRPREEVLKSKGTEHE